MALELTQPRVLAVYYRFHVPALLRQIVSRSFTSGCCVQALSLDNAAQLGTGTFVEPSTLALMKTGEKLAEVSQVSCEVVG